MDRILICPDVADVLSRHRTVLPGRQAACQSVLCRCISASGPVFTSRVKLLAVTSACTPIGGSYQCLVGLYTGFLQSHKIGGGV